MGFNNSGCVDGERMITKISQRTEGGKKISTYVFIGLVADQGVEQIQELNLGDIFLEFFRVVPQKLTPQCKDAFCFRLPGVPGWNNITSFLGNGTDPFSLNPNGIAIELSQNYSFAPLVIPVYANYNGSGFIHFQNLAIPPDVNAGTGYLVEIVTSAKKGEN